MKTIMFIQNASPYKRGEVVAIPEAQAKSYINAKVAIAHCVLPRIPQRRFAERLVRKGG